MTKQSLPAVSAVTPDTLDEFKSADNVVLVAYFDAKDTKSNETFTGVANSLRDSYLFGATNDADVANAEGVKQPGIALYKQFDEGKNVFEDKFNAEAIEKFAKTASVPLIGEVGPETYSGYMAVSDDSMLVATAPSRADSCSGPNSSRLRLRRVCGRARGAHQGIKANRQEAQGRNQHCYH